MTTPVVDNFKELELLGKGGMGDVYKAQQISPPRTVALKFVRQDKADDKDHCNRLKKEADNLRQLKAKLKSGHVAEIYDVVESAGQLCIVMEYIDGPTLQDCKRPLREAVELVEKIARAVHEVHKVMFHRDLKPSNIIIRSDDSPVILDFGLAITLESYHNGQRDTKTGQNLGTPEFSAPEQLEGMSKFTGPESDVYSLGAILYFLIAPRSPHQHDNGVQTVAAIHGSRPPKPLHDLRETLPEEIDTICQKCLRKRPVRRYATAEDLADDLKEFLNNGKIKAKPPTLRERLVDWMATHPAFAAVSAAALIVVFSMGAGFVVWSARQQQTFENTLNDVTKDAEITSSEFKKLRAEHEAVKVNAHTTVESLEQLREKHAELLGRFSEENLRTNGGTRVERRKILEDAFQQLEAIASSNRALDIDRGKACGRLGLIAAEMGDFQESLNWYHNAKGFLEPLQHGDHPYEARLNYAKCVAFEAQAFVDLAQYSKADAGFHTAETLAEQLLKNYPGALGPTLLLVQIKSNRGKMHAESSPSGLSDHQLTKTAIRELARDNFKAAYELAQTTGDQDAILRQGSNLAAILFQLDQYEDSIKLYRNLQANDNSFSVDDPDWLAYSLLRANIRRNHGLVLWESPNHMISLDELLSQHYFPAYKQLTLLAKKYPDNQQVDIAIGETAVRLAISIDHNRSTANVQQAKVSAQQASKYFEIGEASYQRAVQTYPSSTLFREFLGVCQAMLAMYVLDGLTEGELSKAEVRMFSAVEHFESLKNTHPDIVTPVDIASAFLVMGRSRPNPADGMKWLERAHAALPKTEGKPRNSVQRIEYQLHVEQARASKELGNSDKAVSHWDTAIEIAPHIGVPPSSPRSERAIAYSQAGRWEELRDEIVALTKSQQLEATKVENIIRACGVALMKLDDAETEKRYFFKKLGTDFIAVFRRQGLHERLDTLLKEPDCQLFVDL